MGRTWKCAGLRWSVAGGPVLRWEGGVGSALGWGRRVAFGVVEGGVRVCVGARGNRCAGRREVGARGTGGRCEECGRLDRVGSVAADGKADDPREYRVYLAWFGAGLVKVGITAVERGADRLLEQGAVCFTWLGAGPLMAARRAEELLRVALRVGDRVPYGVKRAVRAVAARDLDAGCAELAELHRRALTLPGWPETLAPQPFSPVDHVQAFGLDDAPAATGEITELTPAAALTGELVAAAGPDLHLATSSHGVVILDTRLMTGWELTSAGANGMFPVRPFPDERTETQTGLF
ncbi:DUF2797 domain-containing protein [Streptomyces roseirectus]|uniref:DUF2797 domain-containing protein n=1 Tax=Streptomyces roseirectus TaxID=2768066 RepID=A0A7H0IFZ9_9ACTN|nr:DUF2797 domain-containing protein [Streptomyces roseirectus]QNP71715.1 DUF2797 domain-containing protein [Streptomyces roseirectus]